MAESKANIVKAWLIGEIKNGAFCDGKTLPGDHELMTRFGVSRGTVRNAFSELQRQGLVVRRRGVGTVLSKRGLKRSGAVGLLMPEAESCQFFRDVKYEFVRFCGIHDYEVEFREVVSQNAGEGVAAKLRECAMDLVARSVEGVVFRPLINEVYAKINQEIAHIFESSEIPVVLFDADVEKKPRRSAFDIVAVNNVDAGRSVAEYLIAGGRRRIAFNMVDCVDGKSENLDSRFFGVAGECVVRGLYDGVRPVKIAPSNTGAMKKLLRSRWCPDAFVCVNDEIAVGLVQMLKSLGISVPKDVAVVGFDDAGCARLSVPPLTTVRQPSRQIAQTLLKTLLFRMRSPDAPPQEIYLTAPLVCRGTA